MLRLQVLSATCALVLASIPGAAHGQAVTIDVAGVIREVSALVFRALDRTDATARRQSERAFETIVLEAKRFSSFKRRYAQLALSLARDARQQPAGLPGRCSAARPRMQRELRRMETSLQRVERAIEQIELNASMDELPSVDRALRISASRGSGLDAAEDLFANRVRNCRGVELAASDFSRAANDLIARADQINQQADRLAALVRQSRRR